MAARINQRTFQFTTQCVVNLRNCLVLISVGYIHTLVGNDKLCKAICLLIVTQIIAFSNLDAKDLCTMGQVKAWPLLI